MKTNEGRARRGRGLRLEFLEGRELLSLTGAGLPAAEVRAAALTVKSIRGSVSGLQAPDGIYTGHPVGFVSYEGHGTARPLGSVLIGLQHAVTATAAGATIGGGSGALTASQSHSGNQIVFTYSGTGPTSYRGRLLVAHLTGTVVSGTGQFDGAGGALTGTGRFDAATGKFSLSFHIKLT